MSLPDLSLRRPVMATVLNLLIVLKLNELLLVILNNLIHPFLVFIHSSLITQ